MLDGDQADVIVVGAGGSGLAAAARCVQLGLSVIVLEKRPRVGGTTGIAVGSLTANSTQHQQRIGVNDSVEAHAEDAGKFAPEPIEARNNASLRRHFLSHTSSTFIWLTELGLRFHGPSPEPPNRWPRMHNVVPNAKAYIAVLRSQVLVRGGRIHCNANVVQLQRDDGRVSGVVALVGTQRRTFQAQRAVVLAAGDYANGSEIIRQFKGPSFAAIQGINPYAQGDGHRLAEQAGARLLNMDVTYGPELRFVPPVKRGLRAWSPPAAGPIAAATGKLLPWIPRFVIHAYIKRLLVTWQHPEDELFQQGAILINDHGQRFCDECVWPDRELAVAAQPNQRAFILLDEPLIDRFSKWPHFISTAPEIAYAYVDDYLRLRKDIATQATTVEAVARARGLPPTALRAAVDRTNQRRRQKNTPCLRGDRWVLLGPAKAYFTTTEGGAAINQQMQVLDGSDQVIAGLYAVGQNGLGGQILWSHGLHIAWAITSGKLVAEEIAHASHHPS